jgi:hypothetical protein
MLMLRLILVSWGETLIIRFAHYNNSACFWLQSETKMSAEEIKVKYGKIKQTLEKC